MKRFLRVTLLGFLLSSFCGASAQVNKPVTKKAAVPASQTLSPKAPVVALPADTSITRIRISTSLGEIIVKLYNKTPKHRDNFVKLVKAHFFDSLLFHRVIRNFMIQGGDPNSKNAVAGALLGNGGNGYTVPAEFDSTLYHKRGALCAARNDNPEMASSGCQFYIVQGKTYTDEQLDNLELKNNVKFSPAKRMTYKMLGGTPQLDSRYTVFGEVESGLDIVDKIAQAEKDANNRPLSDIRMRMEILE